MVPKLSLPGLALAAAMMSLTFFSGPSVRVASSRSRNAVTEIGVKSVRMSNGSDLNSDLVIAEPLPETTSV